jgi:hypothetical protein
VQADRLALRLQSPAVPGRRSALLCGELRHKSKADEEAELGAGLPRILTRRTLAAGSRTKSVGAGRRRRRSGGGGEEEEEEGAAAERGPRGPSTLARGGPARPQPQPRGSA